MYTTNGNCKTGVSDWSNCDRCRLAESRTRVVLRRDSERRHPIHLLILGDAPGRIENVIGVPYCGSSYQILLGPEGILNRIPEDFSYTITYLVCCATFDRAPVKAEIELCSPHIKELVQTTSPSGVVYLSPFAEKHFKTKLPSVTLTKPSKILSEEFRLLPVIRNARKLQLFIQELGNKLVNSKVR